MENFQFSPLLAAILNFCEKQKNLNISQTVRDRAVWTEFLTHRVVEKYSVQNLKVSIFATFGGHLEFLRKAKKS